MKRNIKRFIHTVYEFTAEEKLLIKRALREEVNFTELASGLQCSKQQAINLLAAVCKQWVREGVLVIK